MRAVANPRSRFEGSYVEWLGEAPPARLEVLEEDTTRSILSRNESPDVPFRWSVNPYRGCTHACAYCYARPTHEYLGYGAGTDFETRIVVKRRAPELLRRALARRGWAGELIAFSGNTDCYQPLEAHYGLTRRCLEACRDFRNPVDVVTKSFLVTRDVELLADLGRTTSASVAISIPFADDGMARAIEPGAPRPGKRLEALSRLADAGVRTGVLFAPLIPGLNESAIPEVLERAREAGAVFAGRLLLRLPGPVEDVFFARLRTALPDRARRVESRVRQARGGRLTDHRFRERHRGRGASWEVIASLFQVHAARLGLETRGMETPPDGVRRAGEQLPLFRPAKDAESP